jgi:hypothetical protein
MGRTKNKSNAVTKWWFLGIAVFTCRTSIERPVPLGRKGRTMVGHSINEAVLSRSAAPSFAHRRWYAHDRSNRLIDFVSEPFAVAHPQGRRCTPFARRSMSDGENDDRGGTRYDDTLHGRLPNDEYLTRNRNDGHQSKPTGNTPKTVANMNAL